MGHIRYCKIFDCYIILIVILNLLCFLIQCVHSEISCGNLNTPGVTIPQGDIIVREGGNLEIFCHLNENYLSQPNHLDSSHLVFFRNNEIIPDEMITIVNSTTIRLFIENVTMFSGTYYCRIGITGKDSKSVCLNKVAVGTPPKEVENFTCFSMNWENLTCLWNVPENPIKTIYTLTYRLPGRASRGMVYKCPANQPDLLKTGQYRCLWNLKTEPHYRQPYKFYNFTMIGVNVLGQNTKTYYFHHYGNVIPDRPYNITLIEKTSNSATIKWCVDGAIKDFPPGLEHRIKYQSQFDVINEWQEINSLKFPSRDCFTYTLKNLTYAHTYYDIRVQMKSTSAVGDNLWSPFTSYTVRTLSKIPDRPPRADVGSFEISDGIHRDIYVYWQQIKEFEQNGEDFRYTLITIENGIKRNIQPNETTESYAKFKGLSYKSYEFLIYSTNEVGNSSTNSEVYIPSYEERVPEPVSFTKIAYDDVLYELSWRPPPDLTKPLTSYTVFWCQNDKDRPYQCTGYLNWVRIDPNKTAWNQTVEQNGIYQFAISANIGKRSSGMVWASCTVIHNQFVGKMKNVWINSIDSTYIDVGWKLDCSDRIGIVTGFRIYFCPIVSPQNTSCSEPEKHLTVLGDMRTMHGNITNLKPYTTYMVSVAVLTKSGEGLKGDYKLNTTLESAPEPPLNVAINNITNSSFEVSWSPPVLMNGILRYYRVKFNDQTIQVERDTKKLITGLNSFTKYKVQVFACTVACSQSSVEKMVQTKIGLPGYIEAPVVKTYLNDSKMLLAWNKPYVLGGPIMYELKSEKMYKDQIIIDIFNTTDTEMFVMRDCNQGFSSYKWYTRAVTTDENGNQLDGPWSEAVTLDCDQKPKWVVYQAVFGIMLFIIVSFFISMLFKRLWYKWQQMKDVEVKLPPGLITTMGGSVQVELDTWINAQKAVHLAQNKPMKQITREAELFKEPDQQLLLIKNHPFMLDLNEKERKGAILPIQEDLGANSSSSSSSSSSSGRSDDSGSTEDRTHSFDEDDDQMECASTISIQKSTDDSTSLNEQSPKESSLRLRNVAAIKAAAGYTTMPLTNQILPPENQTSPTDSYVAWKAIVNKHPSDTYTQFGVDKTSVNVCSTGYVPLTPLSQSTKNEHQKSGIND